MNLDHNFFQVSKSSKVQKNEKKSSPKMEDQKKKGSSPKMERLFFSPNSGEDQKKEHFFPRIQGETYAQMNTGDKLLEGMQMTILLKLLVGYIPPSPPVSARLSSSLASEKKANDNSFLRTKTSGWYLYTRCLDPTSEHRV